MKWLLVVGQPVVHYGCKEVVRVSWKKGSFSNMWRDSVTSCDVVFRAVMGGQCVAAVKRTGRPEHITVVSARDASAAWTTTVPGEKTSYVHVVCIHPLIGPFFLIICLQTLNFLNLVSVCSFGFCGSGLTIVLANSTRSISSSFSFTPVSICNMSTLMLLSFCCPL